MIKKILSGISAGLLICIGGSVFLSCDNKYVGAILFCVALLCICYKGYALYTGKITAIPEKHGKEEISVLLFGLLGNIIATMLGGMLIRYAIPALEETAVTMCTAKLGQLPLQTLIRSSFCGMLMYLAVSIFREKNTPLGILFCIPVFILSGFEHSIADMFYFSVAGNYTGEAILFLAIVVLGNTIGGVLLPLISMVGAEKNK